MLARHHFRKASNYHLAKASELVRPVLRVLARFLSRGPARAPAAWRRGILLGASHIGDVLYRSASLGALRSGLPKCEWHYLSERGSIPVLETNPDLADVIEGELPRMGSRQFFELARRLRAERFDVTICYNSGRYWPALLLAAQAGIPNRVGYVHKGFSGLVTHPLSLRAPQSFPGYFRDLVAEIIGQKGDWPLRPVVATTEADELEAGALWNELALDEALPVLACFVTTRQPSGVWPRDRYAEVLRRLSERHRLQIILCGTHGDAPVLAELKARHGLDCQIAAGRLGLRALVAFLRRCRGVLCTDSGPRHLANAAGVPVFFVRNLWFNPIEAGRYCETEFDFAPEVELPDVADQEAVFHTIEPAEVAATLAEKLQLSPR